MSTNDPYDLPPTTESWTIDSTDPTQVQPATSASGPHVGPHADPTTGPTTGPVGSPPLKPYVEAEIPTVETTAAPKAGPRASAIIAPALAGGMVAIAVGVYGRLHTPTGKAIDTFGFPSVLSMKAWLATVAFSLALGQLLSALWMYGRLPLGKAPKWLGTVHRWSGTAAFIVSLPVAYHCLWSLGFQDTGTRQLVHSLFGCAFYGAIATKLLALRTERLPGWGLPVIGSLLVTCLTALWLTSSFWFFTTVSFPV